MSKQGTTKLDSDTLEKLRDIKKSTGMSIAETVRRLVKREYERLKRKGVIEKGNDDD
jgi:hypothetical protein